MRRIGGFLRIFTAHSEKQQGSNAIFRACREIPIWPGGKERAGLVRRTSDGKGNNPAMRYASDGKGNNTVIPSAVEESRTDRTGKNAPGWCDAQARCARPRRDAPGMCVASTRCARAEQQRFGILRFAQDDKETRMSGHLLHSAPRAQGQNSNTVMRRASDGKGNNTAMRRASDSKGNNTVIPSAVEESRTDQAGRDEPGWCAAQARCARPRRDAPGMCFVRRRMTNYFLHPAPTLSTLARRSPAWRAGLSAE